MPFKGITFAGQNVTPKNDGGLYQAHHGDGILWGCSMALSGDDLVIQSGEFIAGGRVCWVDGATNVDLSSRTLTNGYIQVVMDFDISKPEGSQWNTHLPLIESATTTFPALTQDDINDTGTLYQVALAIVQVSGGNLVSIYSSLRPSHVIVRDENLAETGRFAYNTSGSYVQVSNTTAGDSGIRMFDAGGTVIGATSGISLRPVGINDNTTQVSISSSGQIIGGALPLTATGTVPSSISASTQTTLLTISGLSSSGVYAVTGYARFGVTANTICIPTIYIQKGDTNYVSSCTWSANTSYKTLTISAIVSGATSLKLSLYSTVGLNSVSATFDGFRIA